jgi:hypothetical protein
MQLVKIHDQWIGARIALGAVILLAGLWVVQGTLGTIMAIAALIPISGGLFDLCLVGSAMGYPLKRSIAHRSRGAGNPVSAGSGAGQAAKTVLFETVIVLLTGRAAQ